MRSRELILAFLLLTAAAASGFAQRTGVDNDTPLIPSREGDDSRPRGIREKMIKLQIEREKKDHDEMLDRGEEVLKLAQELDRSVSANAGFSAKDLAALQTVEKLTKKVIDELGGDDDDDEFSEATGAPISAAEGTKALKEGAAKMVDELKKTTRFSISAAAIEASAAVLRTARLLRGAR